uniref:3-oxo-5-alpha-steroid 4-dehydrogenase C-terminal domain-containing protein n=1 Tax=Kalanchoe fedtschenkoi TaxID=63787 RepID=A0A7N0U5P5_KALFE
MPIPLLSAVFFPPPPSTFVTAMSVISVVSLANAGLSEIRGKHLQYSKFWNANGAKSSPLAGIKLSGKAGMALLYVPALVAALASFVVYPVEDVRFLLICSALALHFFKRVFEVLFIHKYSSKVMLESALVISLSYSLSTATMIYCQYLSKDFPEPSINLMYAGVVAFLIGICGNFYHHYLLSKLRESGSKEYKIPQGGLFSLVICPHYFFEIFGFLGFTLISQTLYALSFTMGTIFYLMGRSYVTRKWYASKFEDFPKHIKRLIPYVY